MGEMVGGVAWERWGRVTAVLLNGQLTRLRPFIVQVNMSTQEQYRALLQRVRE